MRRTAVLGGLMIGAVVLVAALAWWDEAREADAALDDFGAERATLAATAAGELRARLGDVRRDALAIAEDRDAGRPSATPIAGRYDRVAVRTAAEAAAPPAAPPGAIALRVPLADGRAVDVTLAASELFGDLAAAERPGLRFFVRPPGEPAFRSATGERVADDVLVAAAAGPGDRVRIARDRAGALGLPARTAMAGVAHVDAGPLGRWDLAAVASAEHERDRARRGRLRLVLAVVVAGALVASFGGVAIRNQRKEAELERELAARQAARERDEELEKLDRAATMVTLASGVAHEVGTPLGVIVGRAEQLLAAAAGDPRTERALRAIVDQAGRIDGVVRGFLGLARGAAPAIESVAPAAIVETATALVAHRFARAGVALEPHVAADLPELRCDPRLVEHALVNLLLNACDACARGGKVSVDVAIAPGDGGLRFAVVDDGAGIRPEHAERVPEPFFTTKPVGRGTGLGLAIASEIMKSHRGALSIGQHAPRGTRACLTLPIEKGSAHA